MADKQISDLTSASALTDGSLFVLEQAGAAMKANWGMMKNYISPGVAPQYSSSSTYNVGDYVIYNDSLYRCTTAITTAESWTAAHWTAAVLGDDVGYLTNHIGYLPYEWFMATDVTDDYYLNSSGDEVSQVGWSITSYLRIGEKADYYVYTATTSNVVFCWFYDKNKSKISSFKTNVQGNNVLVPPAGAWFVRFSVPTAEVQYFKYTSKILIADGHNSVLPENILSATLKKTFADELYVGFYYSPSGAVSYSENWACTPLYAVNEGDVFYINIAAYSYLSLFDSDRQFISQHNAPTNNAPDTYTIPSGVKYIGIALLKANLGTYVCTLNGQPLGAQYDVPWLTDSVHIWEKKSYISHGDSITWQDGEAYIQGEHIGEIAKGYQTVFAENVNLGRKVNRGKSGWSMAVVNGNGIVNTITDVSLYTQFDLCTIAVGTNDFKLNVPLGNLGIIGDTTFDDTTFYGAYRKSIEYILTNSPTIRLVLITPLQRDKDGYNVNYTNSAGCKLIDYVNAVKALGEMYGLPVCDMYANSGFTKKTLATYTMDGLHPNDVGYKRMGNYLTGFLDSVGI